MQGSNEKCSFDFLLQVCGEMSLHLKHTMLCLEYKTHLMTFSNLPYR